MAEVAAIASVVIAGANFIRQRREAKNQERAQRERGKIETATQRVQDRADRRRSAREERIRRARLIAASEASGGEGSSGQVGALSAIASNFGNAVAGQRGGAKAVQGISAVNQRIASSQTRAKTFQAFTDLALGSIDIYNDVRNAGTGVT